MATICYVKTEPTECCGTDTAWRYIRDSHDNCKYYLCYGGLFTMYGPYPCFNTTDPPSPAFRVPDDFTPVQAPPCTQEVAADEKCERDVPLPVANCTGSGEGVKCISCHCQLDGGVGGGPVGGDPKCCNATGSNLDTLNVINCHTSCYIYKDTNEGGAYLQRGCASEFPTVDANSEKNCMQQQQYGQDYFWFCGTDMCNYQAASEICPGQ